MVVSALPQLLGPSVILQQGLTIWVGNLRFSALLLPKAIVLVADETRLDADFMFRMQTLDVAIVCKVS